MVVGTPTCKGCQGMARGANGLLCRGLVNTFSLPAALVSSLREIGLQIINPATNGDEGGDLTVMVLLGHEAEVHYHSLEAPKDPVTIWRRKSHRGDLPKGLGKSYAIPKESLKG